MTVYRVYLIDNFSGHIEHVREIDAPDDETAIALAEDVRGHCPIELWKGDKKIRRWAALPPDGPTLSSV